MPRSVSSTKSLNTGMRGARGYGEGGPGGPVKNRMAPNPRAKALARSQVLRYQTTGGPQPPQRTYQNARAPVTRPTYNPYAGTLTGPVTDAMYRLHQATGAARGFNAAPWLVGATAAGVGAATAGLWNRMVSNRIGQMPAPAYALPAAPEQAALPYPNSRALMPINRVNGAIPMGEAVGGFAAIGPWVQQQMAQGFDMRGQTSQAAMNMLWQAYQRAKLANPSLTFTEFMQSLR